MISIDTQDRRTAVAVRASYLRTSLDALRRALPLERDTVAADALTEAAATVAVALQRAESEYADLREQVIRAAPVDAVALTSDARLTFDRIGG